METTKDTKELMANDQLAELYVDDLNQGEVNPTSKQTVVITQPNPNPIKIIVVKEKRPNPAGHICLSCLVIFGCFWPLGVVGFIIASKTNNEIIVVNINILTVQINFITRMEFMMSARSTYFICERDHELILCTLYYKFCENAHKSCYLFIH